MSKVRGFAIVAAIFMIATTSLAQSILLEINTNFIVHKLKETGTFASPELQVELPRSFADYTFKLSPSASLVPYAEKRAGFGERLSVVPQKGWEVEIRKLEPEFASLTFSRAVSPLTKALPVSSFGFEVPSVTKIEKTASFTKKQRKYPGAGIADLNVLKALNLRIQGIESEMVPISSKALLEMQQKVTAYSPLGGLETIGKFLRESNYAFWSTDKNFGLTVDTPLVSNWAVYDYQKGYITNLLSSFELGPVSASLSMNEGNVETKLTAYDGISLGVGMTQESTFTFAAGLPIQIGNLWVNAGLEYLPSTPAQYRPNVTALYRFGDLTPYMSFGYEDATPVINAGIFTPVFSAYGGITAEATPLMSFNLGYTSPIGIVTAGIGSQNAVTSGEIGFSSKPFGFDFMQFLLDGNLSVSSLGSYSVSGTFVANFQLMSSYIQAWTGAYLRKGGKPEITYGLEVGF